MTSHKKLIANRLNAKKSTGPNTEYGKRQSRRNALRHGLTAETVIDLVEDSADYKAFEKAVVAEYQPQTIVERELTFRLASLIWRLRRATAIESGLLRIQVDGLHKQGRLWKADSAVASKRLKIFYQSIRFLEARRSNDFNLNSDVNNKNEFPQPGPRDRSEVAHVNIARSFLRLTELDKNAFDRLGRHETRLWRQLTQIIQLITQVDESNHEPVYTNNGELLGIVRR
jgi:hypothetical protein